MGDVGNELLGLPVVFVSIDPPALAILLAVHLAVLLCRELAAVGLAIAFDFVMNRRLLLLQVRRLTRRKRTILDAFADPFLLVPLAIVNLILRQHVTHATQEQSTHHHVYHYAFHVQPPFLGYDFPPYLDS
jgi:hypothetical protein